MIVDVPSPATQAHIMLMAIVWVISLMLPLLAACEELSIAETAIEVATSDWWCTSVRLPCLGSCIVCTMLHVTAVDMQYASWRVVNDRIVVYIGIEVGFAVIIQDVGGKTTSK